MGIALAYLVSLQENAGIDESGLMEQLESVHWKDVDNYMMEMAKHKPALLVNEFSVFTDDYVIKCIAFARGALVRRRCGQCGVDGGTQF